MAGYCGLKWIWARFFNGMLGCEREQAQIPYQSPSHGGYIFQEKADMDSEGWWCFTTFV